MKNAKPSAIVILLTPFQLRQLAITANQFQWDLSQATFFALPLIPEAEIRKQLELSSFNYFEIEDHKISLASMIKRPRVEIPVHKKYVQELNNFIITSLTKIVKPDLLIIGSDKDIFTQLMISQLKRKNGSFLTRAIDEGTGYYKKNSAKDRFFKICYSLFSKLIFGHRIKYIGRLGEHENIDEVYARFVEHIPNKRKWITYHKIEPLKVPNDQVMSSQGILFLSSPLSEDNHCTKEEERDVLNYLFENLERWDQSVFIKPHPREVRGKYDRFVSGKITLLDGSKTGEALNYFNYKPIINFGSSIVLDIYQAGFEMDNLITLDTKYSVNKLAESIYRKGVYIPVFEKDFRTQFNAINPKIYE